MQRIISLFIIGIAVLASCGQIIEPAGELNGGRQVSITVGFDGAVDAVSTKAHVASDGVVYWDDDDQIAVYTSKSNVRTFDCIEVKGTSAIFSGVIYDDEDIDKLSVFPATALKSFDGSQLTVVYPSMYEYTTDAMLAPMAAAISGEQLYFKHLGGLVRIACETVPTDAVALYLSAEGITICGDFQIPYGDDMEIEAYEGTDGNSVKVNFTARRTEIDFNVPVPVGYYSKITAKLVNNQDEVLLQWDVLTNEWVERADMFVREADIPVINGTVISKESTHYGLVTDASTGEGLSGIPVTDGYIYTMTDENGVYQFEANKLCRAVYLSIPAEYEILVSEVDGEPAFWKIGKGRNDFALTPRDKDWNEFSILGFSDVHFYTREKEFGAKEQKPYVEKVVPDINDYISGYDNVIAINTGDNISNWTKSMSVAREEFAKIKKDGVTVPTFNAIGNHDFSNDSNCNSTYECSQDYFNVFGPTEYSLNIGKAHIVFLNNIIYAGHQDGGYGNSMECEYGVTDEVYAWLEADLNTVSDKQDKILIMCMHAPIFNNQFQNYDKIRSLLKTFGESHIISGHNHNNVRREYSISWNGLTGRTSEEHNIHPLSSYWLNDYANDGAPNGYHLFKITGNQMSEQRFKAIGKSENDSQFRVYDGSEVYHEPVYDTKYGLYDDEDGKLYFDWITTFDEGESFDASKCFIVRVFDAGTQALDCKVYFVQNGSRKQMTRVAKKHRDQWWFAEMWFHGWQNNKFPSVYHNGGPNQNYWYYEVPSGHPSLEKNWKVEVELNGRTYESSTISTKRKVN